MTREYHRWKAPHLENIFCNVYRISGPTENFFWLCEVGSAGESWAQLVMLADDISLKFSFFHAFEIKNGWRGSIELHITAFERGDLDASLEKRMKSFGDVLADMWRFKVKWPPIVERFSHK